MNTLYSILEALHPGSFFGYSRLIKQLYEDPRVIAVLSDIVDVFKTFIPFGTCMPPTSGFIMQCIRQHLEEPVLQDGTSRGCVLCVVAFLLFSCCVLDYTSNRAGREVENERVHIPPPPPKRPVPERTLEVRRFSPGLFTTCTFCWDDYVEDDEIHQGHCGHIFHANCLSQWKKDRCPLCLKRGFRRYLYSE